MKDLLKDLGRDAIQRGHEVLIGMSLLDAPIALLCESLKQSVQSRYLAFNIGNISGVLVIGRRICWCHEHEELRTVGQIPYWNVILVAYLDGTCSVVKTGGDSVGVVGLIWVVRNRAFMAFYIGQMQLAWPTLVNNNRLRHRLPRIVQWIWSASRPTSLP